MAETLESCSFCGKHKDKVQKLIVSDATAICNECVNLCNDLLKEESDSKQEKAADLDPKQLKSYLDQYVISQDRAKMVLAVAVVNHYKRMRRKATDPDVAKANILVIGPTGSGKTLLAKTVAKYLDVPFVIADATSITEAGYVGDDVEMLISRLYAAAGNDIERCRRGIVFVDEIDKISRKSESTSITRDVSGEGVQQALLKLVEGTVCRFNAVGNRKHPGGDMIEVDTSEILFIAGGAFVGLETMIKNRRMGTSMGFTSPVKTNEQVNLGDATPDDLVKFGMIPEFVGRFPTVVTLDQLSRDDMVQILTKTKNNLIEQYQWLFDIDGVGLEISSDAVEALVDRARLTGTGARALHSEIEKTLLPHMFDLLEYRKNNIDCVKITGNLVNTPKSLLNEE
jgi:ATP-dependent Clp protease ATP-binding subunit ClpX